MAGGRDEAIAAALGLDISQLIVSSTGGGSGFASTLKVQAGEKQFFVKTGAGGGSKVMFEGEYKSLEAIYTSVPELCPRPIAHGELQSDLYFLATEFLQLDGRYSRRRRGSNEDDTLAHKLAKLHSQLAPSDGKYGFPVTTCCGSTPQDNTYEDTWSSFFIKRRLLHILKECVKSRGSQPDLTDHINRIIPIIHHLLCRLDPPSAKPVVVHGDLWSGNQSYGSIPPRISATTAVVYDPSACYAPAEYDHGIMMMFGGFGEEFWGTYEALVHKGEPKDEYDDRVSLYTLYHTLNHFALFGGGYKGTAIGIMKGLQSKYGDRIRSRSGAAETIN